MNRQTLKRMRIIRMPKGSRRYGWRMPLLVVCLLVIASDTALADDTELFVSGFDSPQACAAPNVLFVIDTSGSMDSEVQTQVSWDSGQKFSGCYDSDQLYFSETGELPGCDSARHFAKSANFCDASRNRLDRVGRFKNLFLHWDADRQRWERLKDDHGQSAAIVECETDRGIHGNGNSNARFAADGNAGPWSAEPDNEPSWASASNVTVFDGNWLNWNSNPPTVSRSRLEVVQEVTTDILDSAERLNVSVMRFNFDEGGPVIHAMESIDTAREPVKSVIDQLEADGFTPLSETLYEAGQYLANRLVDYGDIGPVLSVPESRRSANPTGNKYNSPLNSEGQKTFVVLLTDGEPVRDSSADGKIRALPEFGSLVGPDCDGTGDGRCLDDMAEYLFRKDLRPDVPGLQNVVTHTIGFTLDLPLLESTARRGGGRYFVTDDTASLTAALTELAESFQEDGNLFTAPVIPADVFDRARSSNDVFVSIFGARNTVRWPGNLKKYRIDAATADGSPVLVDKFGEPAIEPETGFFAPGTTSLWSDSADGGAVELGGAANRLPDPDTRRLFTNVSGGDLNGPGGGNRVETSNDAITANLLGAPAERRDDVIEWARGRDILDEDDDGDTDEARHSMGDPLHSQPVVVTYGGTGNAPDSTVFLTTNEGYLHAIDADTGDELWAFIPSRLLGRLYTMFLNPVSSTRSYGLDGQITAYIANNDGQPGITGAERVILLFGMRRGGDGLFALDVTDRTRPRLLWEIDNDSPGYEALGQTWSTPVVRSLDIGGSTRPVVLFAGGYDAGQDNRRFRKDTVGNAIFFADLFTGQLIWSAGSTDGHDLTLPRMKFSIPAALQTLDLDGDGRPDRIYVGDMGGQLWRFDIINGNPSGTLVEGGVLASLGAAELGNSAPVSETRRFYNPVDVVPVLDPRLGKVFISLNIGSGYRAHPLDTGIDEQFFSVRDFRVFDIIDSNDYPEPVTVDELADVTNVAFPILEFSDPGWRLSLKLSAGEKVLGKSTTFANSVFFTSFSPASNGNSCVPAPGINRLYQVSVFNGAAQTNFDNPLQEGPLTTEDRSLELSQSGIAAAPNLLPEASLICVGAECLTLGDENGDGTGGSRRPVFLRSFWMQRETL